MESVLCSELSQARLLSWNGRGYCLDNVGNARAVVVHEAGGSSRSGGEVQLDRINRKSRDGEEKSLRSTSGNTPWEQKTRRRSGRTGRNRGEKWPERTNHTSGNGEEKGSRNGNTL